MAKRKRKEPDELIATPRGPEPRVVTEGFYARVYAMVKKIPQGRVATYGDIGAALGSRGVARNVGFALAALRDEGVPWHRVVNAKGEFSGPNEVRQRRQRKLLRQEGVEIKGGRIDLEVARWRRRGKKGAA